MKKLLPLILALALIVGIVPTASAVNEDVSGTLMIYTSMYQFVIDMMDEAIKAEFPNLEPGNEGSFFFYGGTGSLQTKIAGEMETGTLGCDMMLVAEPAYSLELKEGGWLHQYETEAAANLRFPYDEEGYWYPVRVCNMVLAYNPDLKTPDELPKTFEAFAKDASLKGKISMGNPLTSGTTMAAVAALSDKYGYEYFEGLGANNVMIESGSTALAKLQTGECDVIMILEESVLKDRKEKGSQLACIYPEDGVILIPSTVMTVAEEKSANMNIEACEAITDWLLSEEGQKFMTEGYMHSVLTGFETVPYDSVATDGLIEKDMGVDWVRCYTQREEIRTQFQEKVTVQ
ncbi:MAG: ABC transporter substrate-binding protein [Clostridia bacterium]|nr:ABC transporter substrate-binding protein [Clostridia bacterium]